MTNGRSAITATDEADDDFTGSFAYILAGFEENLDGLDIHGLSLQRLGRDDYRLVLRGEDWRDPGNRIRVVSFTNSRTPFDCFYELEAGLRGGTIQFTVDRYASANNGDGTTKIKRTGFRLID